MPIVLIALAAQSTKVNPAVLIQLHYGLYLM